MVVFGDFDQVVHSQLQLVAGHGGNDQSVQLSGELPHVLFICVHQTLQEEKQSFYNMTGQLSQTERPPSYV